MGGSAEKAAVIAIESLRALSKSGMITTRAQSAILRALTDTDLVAVAEYLRKIENE